MHAETREECLGKVNALEMPREHSGILFLAQDGKLIV